MQNPGFFHEGGTMSTYVNKIGGMNSMSVLHDPISGYPLLNTSPILQATILPAIAVEYCILAPAMCGSLTSGIMNDTYKPENYMNN